MVRGMCAVLLAAAVLTGCSSGDEVAAPTATQTVLVTPSGRLIPTPSPTAPALRDVVARASAGVVKIEVTTCDGGGGSGSGFIVAPNLVATVAHVVDGARTISVRGTGGVVRGELVGVDDRRELALVRTVKPFSGYVLSFSRVNPEVTDQISVIGYPLGRPLSTSVGRVSALDQRVDFELLTLEGMIQTDAAVNPGNSGGPMLDVEGNVVGLVEAKAGGAEGLAYAIPASSAAPVVAGWVAAPVDVPLQTCPDPFADLVTIESRHADAPALAATFHRYFQAINEGWYDEAWGYLTGRRRGEVGGLEAFSEEQSTSQVRGLVIENVARVDDTTDEATVRFVSTQDADHGTDGQTCSSWHLTYTMRMDAGGWAIDSAMNETGSPVQCQG